MPVLLTLVKSGGKLQEVKTEKYLWYFAKSNLNI